DRREAEVHAMRLQLAAHHEAAAARRGDRLRGIAVPQASELAHRGNRREAVAKALHAPALVVHGDEERGLAELADRMRELDELQRRRKVAREEDHAAHLRMLQALEVVGRELEPGDVHHDGAEPHDSSTTNAMAISASSVNETWKPVMPFPCRYWGMR